MPKVVLLYKEFADAVVSAHLERHEIVLREFAPAYWRVDIERRGFLDEAGFAAFCRHLDPRIQDEAINTLLEVLDPYNTKRVTFSSCMSTLLPQRA